MKTPDPSPPPPDDRDDGVDDAAAQWLAQREAGFTPAEAFAFDEWRRADPRHAAAFARMEQTHALLERLPFAAEHLADLRDESVADQTIARAGKKRTSFGLFAVIAAAAAIALSAVIWWSRPTAPAIAQYSTSAGGYERVLLADGSTIELNSSSAVRVLLSAHERRVTLTTGEAHFSVAPDTSRPFVVAAGNVAVRAVGTAFNVRLAQAGVEVLVTHGKVRVSPHDERADETVAAPPPPESAPLLVAGQRLTLARDIVAAAPPPETVSPAAIAQALAWQERKLIFSDTPLQEVVEQFNRRNRTQLVLGDTALASRPVGGTFAADNVAAFVRLLESSGDIVATPRGEHEIVLRKTP